MGRPSKKTGEHYVCNVDFSSAVVEYVKSAQSLKAENKPEPQIPRYIGECIMRISQGLSKRPNFANYSYREDMMMDGVTNCLRKILNFNPEVITRTGKLNAFSYFTQICYFAFLRRIELEKTEQSIKDSLMESGNLGDFANIDDEGSGGMSSQSIVDNVRSRRGDKSLPDATEDDYRDWNRVTRKNSKPAVLVSPVLKSKKASLY